MENRVDIIIKKIFLPGIVGSSVGLTITTKHRAALKCRNYIYTLYLSYYSANILVPGQSGAWQYVVSCRAPWQSFPP